MKNQKVNCKEVKTKSDNTRAEQEEKKPTRIILTDKMTSLEHEILMKLFEKWDNFDISHKPTNNGLSIVDWNGANCGGILWVEYKRNEYVIKYYESQDNKYRVKILKHNCNTATFYYRMEAIEGNKMYYKMNKENAA